MASTGSHPLSPGERCAVERHQNALASKWGHDVSFEDALSDWDANCAVRWREQRQAEILAAQRSEIERHKWIESEKAGRDLGREAVMDWITKNAAAWRKWYDQEHSAG